MLETLVQLLEKVGPEGAAGQILEKRMARELRGYFSKIGKSILEAGLENLVVSGTTATIIKHQVEMKVGRINRINRHLLEDILKVNIAKGHKAGQKQEVVVEADDKDPQKGIDQLGQTGQSAADYAAQSAGDLITGLEQTTIDDIASAIVSGIEDRLGVPDTASLIQDVVDGMSSFRANLIAATEMADAFGEAMLNKINDLGFEYKRIVLSDDACPICQENADADPLPVDDIYPSGDDRPPFHPNCRCAIVAARADDEE